MSGADRLRKLARVCVLVAGCIGAAPALAAPDAPSANAPAANAAGVNASSTGTPAWGLHALMQALATVKSAQARFVEYKTLSILTQPLESSGTLAWRAPDRVEKRTLKPRVESLVLEGNQLTIEIAGKPRQVLGAGDQPIVWAFVESIRSTLAGDLPTLEKYYRVRLEGRAARWTLILVPLSDRMRGFIAEIRIGGSAQRMHTVEVIEASGDRSLMRIDEAAP